MARLLLESGGERREIKVAGPVVVGRERSAGVYLDDKTLSREHTKFYVENGKLFVRDRLTATTDRVSVDSAGAQANDRSDFPAISADGSVVAFVSTASNLVPDDTNVCGSFMTPGSCPDLFVRVRTITATPGPPTTGTTPPCTSSGCPVDSTPTGAACAGEAIPARVTTLLERAASLVDQAATSPAKKARKLLIKARKALRQAKARATRAARSRRPTLSAGCAAALRDAADRLAAQP